MTAISSPSASIIPDRPPAPPVRPDPVLALRRRVNILFDDGLPPNRPAQIFNALLAVLIVTNVMTIVFESVEPMRRRYEPMFTEVEWLATVCFAVEYGLRLWTAPDRSSGLFRDPLFGRLRYARRFVALIDLISILPAILGSLGAADLRVLRLIRLLRLLKLTRHSTAFSLIWAVVREEARTLSAIFFIAMLLLVMSASIMFMIENEAQPRVFSSIPTAMWWAVVTLTTVGYGDMVPITPVGRVFGGLVAIAGIGVFALFSGVLTVSFMDQLRLRRERYRRMVEADLAGTRTLSPAAVAAIERIGEEMGLPVADVGEIVDRVVAGQGTTRAGYCAHCGQKLPADGA